MGLGTILSRLLPTRSHGAALSRSSRVLHQTVDFFQGSQESPPQRAEKIRVHAGMGKISTKWFLPYLDSTTGETEAMRIAYRGMIRSPFVKSGLQYKVSAVQSLDWQIQANDPDSPRENEACNFIRHCIDRIPEGMPGLIQSITMPRLIDGWQVAETVVEVERKEPKFRGKIVPAAIKAKKPDLYDLEVDEFNNVFGIKGKGVNTLGHWPICDFLYSRHLPIYDEPAGNSDLRAAYSSYWMADTVVKLRAIHTEKATSPFLLGTYVDSSQQPALSEAMAAARTQTWIAIPDGTKIEAISMAGSAQGDFKQFLDDCNQSTLIAILGAYLQVLQGQVPDGRGSAEVSKSVTELLIWLLAVQVQEVVNKQLIPKLIGWNYAGIGMPRLVLGGASEQEIGSILDNVLKIQQAGGKPSAKDFYRRIGYQRATGPEDELTPMPAAQPGQIPGGQPGLPFAQPQPANAAPVVAAPATFREPVAIASAKPAGKSWDWGLSLR